MSDAPLVRLERHGNVGVIIVSQSAMVQHSFRREIVCRSQGSANIVPS